jgi:hypothetical protein
MGAKNLKWFSNFVLLLQVIGQRAFEASVLIIAATGPLGAKYG